MLKRTYVNNDLETLKTALETCPILQDCTISVSNNTLTITDSNGHTLFELAHTVSPSDYTWKSYASESLYTFAKSGSSSYPATMSYCYVCDNGVIIYMYANDYGEPIRIVKTTDDRIAFITYRLSGQAYPYSETDGFSNTLDCVAYGDVAPLSTFSMTTRYDTHGLLVPMITNSAADVLSYTAKSGFLAYSTQDLTLKVIEIGGKNYITDSFFAIEIENLFS